MYNIFTRVDDVYLGLVIRSNTQHFTLKLLNTACLWSESSQYQNIIVVLWY